MHQSYILRLLILAALILANPAHARPLFKNSVVSNDIDFITQNDRSTFACLFHTGTIRAEMPDKRSNELFVDNVDSFSLRFTDGTSVDMLAHPDFGGQATAEGIVTNVGIHLGRLPHFMRRDLSHIVLHKGDETAFAESEARFFVLYDQNIARRIGTHDLEETMFHESIHATLDAEYRKSESWLSAQSSDGTFITDYAAAKPDREDLAETALFAFAYTHHPERLPKDTRAAVAQLIPARLAFFRDLFDRLEAGKQHAEQQVDCTS